MRALVPAALLSSLVALAQVSPEPADAGVPEVAPPPAAIVLPPAPPPAPPELDRPFWELIRIYGIFKPTLVFSGHAVESYSQPNGTAITAAANPMLAASPMGERLTFQVGQSRLGFQFNEKGAVRAQLELDFVDFTKASPTVASVPRLRIAKFDWVAAPWVTLSAGQDWDLHAPLNPHGSNMVGAQFLSGNSGFMRQQVKGLFLLGKMELAGAVGFASPNVTAKDGATELGLLPTFAVRGSWALRPGTRVGVSGIASSLTFAAGTPAARHALAGSAAIFGELTVGTLNARLEAYLGRNAANLGLLTLGLGSAAGDVDEWGGFISARYGITPNHFLYAHAGIAHVLDMSTVRPSYAVAPGVTTVALAGTGPGICSNIAATLGYELRLSKMLGFLLEGFYFNTEHRLLDADMATTNRVRSALGGELAAIVTF